MQDDRVYPINLSYEEFKKILNSIKAYLIINKDFISNDLWMNELTSYIDLYNKFKNNKHLHWIELSEKENLEKQR